MNDDATEPADDGATEQAHNPWPVTTTEQHARSWMLENWELG